jgi:hypothetical protein
MTERTYGAKYDSKLSSKEIAAVIRQNIKNAIATGKLPKGLKVSVRYDHFSGGTSIDARITAWPEGFMWLNPDWCVLNTERPDQAHPSTPRYTKQGKTVLEALKEIHGSYNHDGSDSMVDHFDVKYYGAVDVDWELEKPECERVYKRWRGVQTPSAHSESQADALKINLGDEVTFTHGPLAGHRFIVIDIGMSGPKNVSGGLSLDLRAMVGGNLIYADGDDLGYLKIVKRVPQGMRVIRFKH